MTRTSRDGLGVLAAAAMWILALIAPALTATALSAPPAPVTESLEWGVEQAQRIVRGTVRPGTVRSVTLNGVEWLQVTLDVEETLKGPTSQQLTFLAPVSSGLREATQSSWADVLAFLRETPTSTRANAGSVELATWAVKTPWSFILGDPSALRDVYRMDGSRIKDPEELLRTVREAVTWRRQHPDETWVMRELGPLLPPPGDLPAPERDPWKRRRFAVPGDGRLNALARRWATHDDPGIRAAAIEVLGLFRSPENVGLLRVLLDDPFFEVIEEDEWVPRVDERAWRLYQVRAVALKQLNAWNEDVGADAVVRTALLRYAPLDWRRRALAAGAALLALLLWPRRLRGPSAGAVGVIACCALLVALGALWLRGGRTADTLSVASAAGDWEIALHDGRVTLLRVQDNAPPHSAVVRSISREDRRDTSAWFTPMLAPREQVRKAGIAFAEGVTKGPTAYPYRLIELPYWLLAALLLAWPATWGARRVRRTLRRNRWRREGRCGTCGYSLHGIVTARCPECGAPTDSADAPSLSAVTTIGPAPSRPAPAHLPPDDD